MAELRVLHMIGSLNMGGSQTMIMNLYRNLDRKKIQFDFILDHPDQLYFAKEAKQLGGRIYFMPTFTGKNILEVVKAWNVFFQKHTEYKILHSHVRSYASVYLPIAKKYGLKTIIHSHSTSNGKGVSSIIKRILQFPLRYQADYLMACSNEAGQWLYGAKGCKKDNYLFIPNAIYTEKYRFSEKIATEYRKKLNLEDKFVIGHVGRFHEAKNHMFLLEVFAKICEKRSDAILLLVGDGDLRQDIQMKIHSLNLDNKVLLTGSRNDVPQLFQVMDVFMFPSIWEGLPVTVIEAQAAGVPCLISDKITTDVDISKLIFRLPIDDSCVWVDAILNTESQRCNVIQEIKRAGFDVKDSVANLEKFYCAIINNDR